MRNFVKSFLEIEKDGVCLQPVGIPAVYRYSIIDIVCKIL